MTPLMIAIAMHNNTTIKILTDKPNIDLTKIDQFGKTTLYLAIYYKNIEAIAKILSLPNNALNQPDDQGMTPLHLAASFNPEELDLENLIKMLIAAGADKSIRNNDGQLAIDLTEAAAIRNLLG